MSDHRRRGQWPTDVPHPNSPAGSSYDWASLGMPHPRSPAARRFDWPASGIVHPNSPAGHASNWASLRVAGVDAEKSSDADEGAQQEFVESPPPENVDALIERIQEEFPEANIRIIGRGRSVEKQAELMAKRRRTNKAQFLRMYKPATHITEMDKWVTAHPAAGESETARAFAEIITRARRNGAVVSNHLNDCSRDISVPDTDDERKDDIRRRMEELGGLASNGRDSINGLHWHVDFVANGIFFQPLQS